MKVTIYYLEVGRVLSVSKLLIFFMLVTFSYKLNVYIQMDNFFGFNISSCGKKVTKGTFTQTWPVQDLFKIYLSQPLYNTIVAVKANFPVSYPNRVVMKVKCIVTLVNQS